MEPTMPSLQQRLLDCYDAIGVATSRMLQAARSADWSAFEARERECRTWMERIERLGNPAAALDGAGRRQRMEVLRRVLRDDAEIRELLQPWLGEVERCLHGRFTARLS